MSTEHAEVQEKFQIRTDLALEAREALTEDGRQTSGIVLESGRRPEVRYVSPV